MNRILSLLVILIGLSLSKCSSLKDSNDTRMTHDPEWSRVDSLEDKGLYRSAWDVVESIYSAAEHRGDFQTQYKALCYALKYAQQVEDGSELDAISRLESVAEKAELPLKAIAHSMAGEAYWSYFQNHNWEILQRTSGAKVDDIRLWDLSQFVDACDHHYSKSLSNRIALKAITLDQLDPEILSTLDNTDLRPSLYEIMAFRALEFYQDRNSGLTRPKEFFSIDAPWFYGPAKEFMDHDVPLNDTLSFSYRAIRIYQDLLSLQPEGSEAFYATDLERLRFVKEKSSLTDRKGEVNDLYFLQALQRVPHSDSASSIIGEYLYEQARTYMDALSAYSEGKDESRKGHYLKAEAIAEEVLKDYPKSIGASSARNILLDIREKTLYLTMEEVLIPGSATLARVDYRNIDHVYLRVVEIPEGFIKNDFRDEDKYVKELCKLEVAHSWDMALQASEDHHSHSTETLLPALPPGRYALLASDESEFKGNQAKAYAIFWSSLITLEETPLLVGGLRCHLINRDSGEDLEGATVKHYVYEYNRGRQENVERLLTTYTSDKKGEIFLPFIQGYGSQFIDVTWKDQHLITPVQSRYPMQEIRAYERTSFFLDRSIYRPGQTVYFKGIHLEVDKDGPHVKANQTLVLTFRDANSQEVSKLSVQTNEFGSFSGTFTIPSNGLTGLMSIQGNFGTAGFSVEEYKRPRFKVEIDPVEGSFALSTDVKLTGKAMGYNGAPITDAKVRYSVKREPVLSWRYWCWWYRPPFIDRSPVQILQGETMTDAEGRFELTFEAKAGNTEGGDDISYYSFTSQVAITDLNGETRESSLSVNIGDKPLLLSSDIPSDINKQSLPEIHIKTENLNGQALPSSGQWELRFIPSDGKEQVNRKWDSPQFQGPSDEEFKKALPLFKILPERSTKPQEGELISTGEWNTNISNLWEAEALAKAETGQYHLKLVAQETEPVEWEVYFTLYDPTSEKAAYSDGLKTIDVGGVYLPGEKAEILLSSAWTDVPVQLELEYNRQIVWSKEMLLDKSQQRVQFPIEAKYQEGAFLHVKGIRHNRPFMETLPIKVTPIDRTLEVMLSTYRDKMLPGAEEEWQVKVKASNGEKAISELLLSMYDVSLDQFKMHQWNFSPWSQNYPILTPIFRTTGTLGTNIYAPDWYDQRSYSNPQVYPSLNRFGYYTMGSYEVQYEDAVMVSGSRPRSMKRSANEGMMMDMAADMPRGNAELKEGFNPSEELDAPSGSNAQTASDGPQIRTNFQETAFFYPHLKTDLEGDLIFSFKMPESLTSWKFQALAHTNKVQTGYLSQEVITQKELMVVPNPPRFLREGDRIDLSTKVVNLAGGNQKGKVSLQLLDAISMKDISADLISGQLDQDFDIVSQGSKAFSWSVKVPEDHSAITYRFVAQSESHSDGEEDVLPVLSNRMLVTEAMPFAITKESEKSFDFVRMKEANASTTVEPYALTLEFTANPVWYVVQAMPYMMEYPYDCSEQIFTRYYANELGSSIIESRPRLKTIINQWKDLSPDAFLSNLEKNQELKYVLLEETPWVIEAKDESERKKRLSLLLDMNHMSNQKAMALDKLLKSQDPSGGWPWFAGMRPNLYITQYILSGLGHLKALGLLDDTDYKLQNAISEALDYLDREHLKRYRDMRRYYDGSKKENHTGPFEIQYLYTRSYFMDREVTNSEAFDFYRGQAKDFWLDHAVYLQGMSALALNRLDESTTAQEIMRSVKEQAMMDEDLGMYWKDQRNGWYWYEAGIERHALMVEAFSDIMQDDKAVYGLKQWLIFNKQTNDWETTRATAEACYAMLLGGQDWTEDRAWTLEIGDNTFKSTDPKLAVEAGTGYLKYKWEVQEIKANMSKVTVTKEGEAPAWGAVYYQYFEQLDKITASESPIKIRKQVFKVKSTDTGEVLAELNTESVLKVGDRVRIRMEVETDREMEFVHIKDMRNSGVEPVDVISGMVYSGGLGFYKSTRDASTNFFIDDLNKGAYVLEYDVFVSQKGDFSNGISTIQCMYAPEFTSHSSGIRLMVD